MLANLFSSCYDKSTVVKKYAPNLKKYTIKLKVLYFIPELWLWITQTRGNRHGWATSTQVCIPGRGAGLLEGAGGETPTEVTYVKTVTCWNASGSASCFCWIPNTVSPPQGWRVSGGAAGVPADESRLRGRIGDGAEAMRGPQQRAAFGQQPTPHWVGKHKGTSSRHKRQHALFFFLSARYDDDDDGVKDWLSFPSLRAETHPQTVFSQRLFSVALPLPPGKLLPG